MTRVIAIDGPSGAGKSSVARAVGAALGLPVLDTGAMYRSVTLAVLEAGSDPHDDAAAAAEARAHTIDATDGRVLLDDRDVGAAVRDPRVTTAVSTVSAHAGVRAALVDAQRAWVRAHCGGVVEGRDIGTVVFPDAVVKVFLTASPEERARRRQRDEAAADRSVDLDAVREALAHRDQLDTNRTRSPLRAAEDALVIDTTGRAVDEVAGEVIEAYRAASGATR